MTLTDPQSRDAMTFKYLSIRDHLLDLINRDLAVGDAIPSERHLATELGVSRMTVRQAVETLVAEGLLQREQGKGTFVAPQPMDFEVRLTTFDEEMRRRGIVPTTSTLTAQVVQSTAEVSEALGCEQETPVLFLYRVRYGDGEPMSVEQQWIPHDLVSDIDAHSMPDSTYAALRARGIEPEWGEEVVSAGEATDTEASLLGLGTSRVVLRSQRRTYSGNRAVAYSKASYRADRYTVWVPLAAPRPTIVPSSARKDAKDQT